MRSKRLLTYKTTVEMMHKSSKFDMALLRRRCRKTMRVKHGKKIQLSLVDRVWKDYINLSLIPSLINYGKVQIDKHTSIEIVGKKEIKLLYLKKGGVSSTTTCNKLRAGISYKIVYSDTNFKNGVLVFKANNNVKKAVSEALMNTNNYYRIAQ